MRGIVGAMGLIPQLWVSLSHLASLLVGSWVCGGRRTGDGDHSNCHCLFECLLYAKYCI